MAPQRYDPETGWATQEDDALLRVIVDGSADGLLIVDAAGVVQFVNPAAEDILGRGRDELLGAPLGEPIQAETTTEIEVLRKGGEVRIVEMRTSEIRWRNQPATLAALTDVTARRRLEAERVALIAELEGKNADLERFAYAVSHDLRGPMLTISGYLNFLQKDLATGTEEAVAQDIAHVLAAAEHMQQMLEGLQAITRLGRATFEPIWLSLTDLAEQARQALAGPLRQAGATVEVAPNMPEVFGDPLRLREVLMNLIENAIKFRAARPPVIAILAERDGQSVLCRVRDNGRGLSADLGRRVFDLFVQGDSQSPGSGFGLALVREIITRHGGEIWVEPHEDAPGCTFCFRLPARADILGIHDGPTTD